MLKLIKHFLTTYQVKEFNRECKAENKADELRSLGYRTVKVRKQGFIHIVKYK